MHDSELEQRLRAALRTEGDDLAFRVDVERLEAELVVRRRAARSGRFGVLAAAVGVIAFGLAAAGINGMLSPGTAPGVGSDTAEPCTSLAIEPTSLEAGVRTPPAIVLVDAAGVAHHGGLDIFRFPGASTVQVRGRPGGERALDPRTVSLEVTTAERACLRAVQVEYRPARGGSEPETERVDVPDDQPQASIVVKAPPPGKWLTTVRATFDSPDGVVTSVTTFRIVSSSPSPSARPDGATPTPPASPLPVTLTRLEGRPDATVVLEVAPTWSGPGARHVVDLLEPRTTITTVQVACIDESVSVDTEGAVTDLGSITITTDDGPMEAVCMGEQPTTVIPSLTDQATAIDIVVPANVAYTVHVDSVPAPEALPTIELIFGTVEVEGASENPLPDWSAEGGPVRSVIGTLDEGFAQEAVVVCLGPGTLRLEFRDPTAPPEIPASGGGMQCTGDAQQFTVAAGARGPHDVVVEADARAAWHVVAGSDGSLPPFEPPGFYMSSWLNDTDVTGSVATGIAGCDRSFIVDGESQGAGECGPPEWPDMTNQSWVIARPDGELRVRLDEGWSWDAATVRAAPSLQTGRNEPPVNVWDVPARVVDNVLVVPVELSTSRWVLRVDVETSNDDKAYHGDMYFVVDVQP